MKRVLSTVATAMLAGAFLLVVPGNAQAALQPNDSIFFYKPGTAMFGTLHNGVFNPTQTVTANMSGWNAATLGRDTLVLLNTSNGHTLFAKVTAGNYTFASNNVTVTKGFTKLSASCDSILFYSPGTGRVVTAKLGGGAIDIGHSHEYAVAKNFTAVNSSCNTVTFLNNKGAGIIGTLKGGLFSKKGALTTGVANPQLAHTDTSFMRFSSSAHTFGWGKSGNGAEHVTRPQQVSSGITKIAGTATSGFTYDAGTGESSSAKLVNGVASNAQSYTLTTGWQLIVGGR